jgi:hypothetical protein
VIPPVTQPIPASKLLASQCRSDRGACGFVLVANLEAISWRIDNERFALLPEHKKLSRNPEKKQRLHANSFDDGVPAGIWTLRITSIRI